jgi:hypothetical protein
MLTHIKSACIHSTDGVAGDRALSASGMAPSRQGQALSLDVQNDSSRVVFVLGTSAPSEYISPAVIALIRIRRRGLASRTLSEASDRPRPTWAQYGKGIPIRGGVRTDMGPEQSLGGRCCSTDPTANQLGICRQSRTDHPNSESRCATGKSFWLTRRARPSGGPDQPSWRLGAIPVEYHLQPLELLRDSSPCPELGDREEQFA